MTPSEAGKTGREEDTLDDIMEAVAEGRTKDFAALCDTLRAELSALRSKYDALREAADGMAEAIKESPGQGHPVPEVLRIADGMLFGYGGGPVQQDLGMIADAMDSALARYESAKGAGKP